MILSIRIAILGFMTLMSTFGCGLFTSSNVNEVTVTEANKLLENGALMIDVREKNEVDDLAYDVVNLVNIPLSEFTDRLNEIPKDKQLIMACRSGNRSRKASGILLKNGYKEVVNMAGGIKVWEKNDLKVKK